ncbi:MAG: tetratricopeptide repeat protein, partial [Rhodospirillaceae bacterium]|nr:tetratricopeptide repeat protein [Rhodospirillaceae bacterium]
VIARNSTFAYKGEAHDLRQVAGELGVRYVLEGSIRSGANRLRITAQLIDATDGSHLWAERFDRSVDDIFDIQDEITKEIVTALRVKLTDGEEALVWSRGTSDVEAWHLCVRAMELQTRFNTKDYLEARDLAEKALKLDPNYAQAWVTLGFSYWWDGRLGYTGDTEAKFVRADECAQRAMALDDTVSWSNGLSAMVAAALGRYEEGIVIAQRGVELHPGNADVRAFYAYSLFHAGNYEAAVDQYRAAMSLNPICPNWYKNGLARTLALVGEFAEALTFLDEIIESEPTHIQGWLLRAYILGQIGRMSEAKAAVKEAAMLAPDLRLGHLIGLQLIRDADALKRFADGLRAIGLPE